jgi:hypothetical protein
MTIAALLVIGLLPVVLMLHFVTSNWLPLPFWDEWDMPGGLLMDWYRGTLTFGELFHQHNESRKFFPALLYLCMAKIGGWDVRATMALVFVSVCVIATLTYRLLRQMPGATTLSALTAWVVVTFLCFSGSQFENFLWGIQIEPFFPGLALLAIIAVNMSKVPFHWRTICTIGLALVATYTFANGMLLWALGVPLPPKADTSSRKKLIKWYALYAACTVISISSYFIGYFRPSNSPPFASVTANVSNLTQYLVLWAGSYFMTPKINPQITGVVVIVFFVAAICGAIISAVRKRNWRTFYSPLLISAYACITAAVTAVGRLGFGVEQALVVRYLTFSLFFYLAIVTLVYALYCSEVTCFRPFGRLLSHMAVAIVALLALVLWLDCYRYRIRDLELLHEHNAQLLVALEWIAVIPHNPDLGFIYHTPEKLQEYTRVLSEHKVLRLPFVGDSMARAVMRAMPLPSDASHGQLESCSLDKDGNLLISGWAWLPQSNRPSDCVVLGVENAIGGFEPITVSGTGVRRPDLVAQTQNQKLMRAGFFCLFNYQNIEPAIAGTIKALAIDLQGQKVYPLPGECTVSN